jgi:acyl-CoA thioester hydrolase
MIITPIQIRFNDMDPMRRVNNATYSSYLELGRLDFCNKYLTIRELNDIPFVLVHVELDLLKSLRPLSTASVYTWVSKIGTTSWEFSYKILDTVTSDIYVQAKSVQVYFNYHKDCKESIPLDFQNFLKNELILE